MGLGRSRGAPWPSHQPPLFSSRTQNISRRLRARRALRPLTTHPISPVRSFQPIRQAMAALFRRIWPQLSSNFRPNIAGGKAITARAGRIGPRLAQVTRLGKSICQEALRRMPSRPCHGLRHASPLSLFLCNITLRPFMHWSRVSQPTQLNGGRFSTYSPDTRRSLS